MGRKCVLEKWGSSWAVPPASDCTCSPIEITGQVTWPCRW